MKSRFTGVSQRRRVKNAKAVDPNTPAKKYGMLQGQATTVLLLLIFLVFASTCVLDFGEPLVLLARLIVSNTKSVSSTGEQQLNDKIAVGKKTVRGFQKGDGLGGDLHNFKTTKHHMLQPKDTPIDGRKIKFTELKHKDKDSSVHIFIADNFLSDHECDALSSVHNKHVIDFDKRAPLICFDSVHTLQKNLEEIGSTIDVQTIQFMPGTLCLNESVSSSLKNKLSWSYSTAFYPGESKFSHVFENRVELATGLKKSHGGKFQITSYPQHVGYKNHTDCSFDDDQRDRFATVLVYLQNVKEGGETKFPRLGISVKPKKGRLLVWNSMTMKGKCDLSSLHNAAKVTKGRKYILQRWYYYENFYSLGKRPAEPSLPSRKRFQARVSCDQYESGSCRWYDEWGYDHLLEYNKVKNYLP